MPGWRCGASARAPSFAPGCSRSSPTRRATACAAAGAATAWPSARRAELAWQPPAGRASPAAGDGRLRDALAALPERDRSVIACRFVLDLGEEETAAVLGIARGTVKSRTARALDRLRSEPGGRGMTLERDLRALADGFPETPALAPRRARGRRGRPLRGAGGGGASRCSRSRSFLLVPATALAVSPRPARSRARDVRAAQRPIERVTRLPDPVAADARRLQLGSQGLAGAGAQRTSAPARAAHRARSARPTGSSRSRCRSGVDVTFLYEPRTVAERIGRAQARARERRCAGRSTKTILGKTIARATQGERARASTAGRRCC